MGCVQLPMHDHPRSSWEGIVLVLFLATLPLLAASTSSAFAAQTAHPVNYLPLVMWQPFYRITFVSRRDGNEDIYVMNQDGSGQINLTKDVVMDYYPAWSPK